jgi:hypothetical protein
MTISPRTAALAFLAPVTVAAVFTAGITYGADNPAAECTAVQSDVLALTGMAMQKAGPRPAAQTPAERARRERRQKAFDDFWKDFTRESGN